MKVEAQHSTRVFDVLRPQQFFMERERAESGHVVSVATLFLTNRECPWRCVYCDLWKHTTVDTVPRGAIPAQIDFALQQLGEDDLCESPSDQIGTHGARPSNATQIKLYNSGSFFDPKAVPPDDYEAIAERVRDFARVIVECHPALAGKSAVQFKLLLGAAKLEVAMGLEVADDALLGKLNKRMTLAMFRRAAEFLVDNGIAVRAFVIVKPPFVTSDAQASELACRSVDFAFNCGAGVVSLIPARFGPVELDELARAGKFSPPSLDTVEAVLDYGVRQRRGSVFADLWDMHRLSGCSECQPDRIARLREINFRQIVLPRIECAHERTACRAAT